MSTQESNGNKRKRSAQKSDEQVAASSEGPSKAQLRKEAKKARKQAKKEEKKQKDSAEKDAMEVQAQQQVEDAAEKKPQKKKAKVESTESDDKQSKKKSKKEKKAKKEKKDAKKDKKAQNDDDEAEEAETTTTSTSASAASASSSVPGLPEGISASEANKFLDEHNITVSGDGIDSAAAALRPILTFEHARAVMAHRIREEGLAGNGGEAAVQKMTTAFFASTTSFAKPTPIQSQCWPILLAKRDVVGIAETGSGKTLAFLLPSLLHIKKTTLGQGGKKSGSAAAPIVLVVSPTRELAMQTAEVAAELGSTCNAKSVCIYGGVPKDEQRRVLRAGVQIVVATPGRLLDLVNDGVLTLANVDYIVLDEADRMLDLGFEEDIRNVMRQVRQERQTLMFSATWPQAIQQLASEFLKSPVKVAIGSQDLQACKRVKQIVEVIDQHARDNRLDQLLKQYQKTKDTKIIIFVLYKKEAVRVEGMLARKGWRGIQAIHGDKHQNDRTNSLHSFKTGRTPILIATDVAARGLDIPDVECVINYSFPLTIEDYVHRIGRTGRAGKEGLAHTMFTDFDKARAGELVNVLREAGQEVPEKLTRYGTHVKKKEHKLYGAHFKDISTPGGAPAAPKRITFD